MMRFDLQTRLGWFDSNHVQLGSQVRVVEANEEGEAEVTISSTNRLLLVNTSDKSALRYLSQRKVADGTVCEFLSDDAVILHLMECKRTVKENTWRQIKEQFQGALLNAFAVCGLLNVKQIAEVRLYTAYREDKLDPVTTANPSLLKAPVGGKAASSAIEWRQGQVRILDHGFKHQKVPLDHQGLASITF